MLVSRVLAAMLRLGLYPLGETGYVALAENFFVAAHVDVAVLPRFDIRCRNLAHHLTFKGKILVANTLIGTHFGLGVRAAGILSDIAVVALAFVA